MHHFSTFVRTTLGALLLATAVLAATLAPAATDKALEARLDAAVERAVTNDQIVGTVVIVARRGQVVYRKAFGLDDREAGTPMSPERVFRLASMTKPLVSAAVLALAEQGKLGLDDPVTRWLPWFTPALPDGSRPTITVRQLLNHTSGLSYGFLQPPGGAYATAGVSDGLDRTGLTLDENLARLASAPWSSLRARPFATPWP